MKILSNSILALSFVSIITCTSLFSQTRKPVLLINELMASNSSCIADPDFKDYADWIEIYNPSDTAVQLDGFYLTDKLSKPDKWKVNPGTMIAAKSYIIFWADNRDTTVHTNFQLSADGEQIGLFDSYGNLIDSVTYYVQKTDVSFGRYPNASGSWTSFNSPTPGLPNKSGAADGWVNDPVFSLKAGFYTGTQNLILSSDSTADFIRYTTDGSIPCDTSHIYSQPIKISKTTAIRAQACRNAYAPGNIVSHTFFIDDSSTLPVVSLITDPKNLWSDSTGIYVVGTNGITGYCRTTPANWNQEWERPASIEYYDVNKKLGFTLDAGIQIGGQCTRLYPEKPLAVYTRDVYGGGKIRYKLYGSKNIDAFNNMVLSNAGQDWYRTMFRDCLMQNIVRDQMDIDWLAYQPAIVYLNGEYWGIHHIREKHNEHYLEENYGVDPDKVDILSNNAAVNTGSADSYKNLISFISANDLRISGNYNYVAGQMDINEYLNYLATEAYFANADWPGGNIKYWRAQGDGHKWRWTLYDTDLGFGAHTRSQYDYNNLTDMVSETSTSYANPPWSTLLMRKLLSNDEFKNHFVQRLSGYIQTTFEPNRVRRIIDSLKTLLAPEIPRHKAKWTLSMSFGTSWENLTTILTTFANERPQRMKTFLAQTFKLSGQAYISLRNKTPEAGKVYIENIPMPDSIDIGFYKNIPVYCTAVPAKGYRFAGWQGLSQSSEDSIQITLTANGMLNPIFVSAANSVDEGKNSIPDHFELAQNYPNPFNPSTVIRYQLPEASHVTLKVYDMLGKEIRTLVDEYQPAGSYNSQFTIQNSKLSSGAYLFKLTAGKFRATKKLLLMK